MTTANVDPNTEILAPNHPLAIMLAENAVIGEDSEIEINEAFITEDGTCQTASEVLNNFVINSMRCFSKLHAEASGGTVVQKSAGGSNQSHAEMKDTEPEQVGALGGLGQLAIVDPPYPPELLAAFLEVDSVHFRCVRVKVVDSVGRDYVIEPVQLADGGEYDAAEIDDAGKKQITEEIKTIKNFIEDCNEIHGFEGTLDKACMDYESIGWGVIEVIRSKDGHVRHISHLPAARFRVLKGWGGFVERVSPIKLRYYQKFGDKIYVEDKEEPDGRRSYNPRKDGPLDMSNTKLKWNMINKDTGAPTSDISKAANEVLFVPKVHINTVYYGMTDIIPALGDLLTNVHIRDYMLQYFEHNTVPRYAVIIEGAKISDPVKNLIQEYFSTHVKGKPHKTLIIPVPALRGEVHVRFEKLDADRQEGSFIETRKAGNQGTMTAHGVSPAIIGISEQSELGSGKGLSQAEIYKDRIVSPCQRLWDGKINRLFRLGLGVSMVSLYHTPLDIRDQTAEKDILVAYVDHGMLSINQAKKLGQLGDAVKGGNRPFINTTQGLIFLDEIDEMTSENLQKLEDEITGLKTQATVKAAADKANKMPTAGRPKTPGAAPVGTSGTNRKNATKPTTSKASK